MGQMKHASIAAFARFSMQLLALGAPSDLSDEQGHAALAFRFVRWALEQSYQAVRAVISWARSTARATHCGATDVVAPCLEASLSNRLAA